MMIIKAKENATIEVIDGDFPIGQRETLKVIIEDKLIKEYIKAINTGTCSPKNNLYSYGDFTNTRNLILELAEGSTAEILPYYKRNKSSCLKLKANNGVLGKCTFRPDKSYLIEGKEYILSFDIYAIKGSLLYMDFIDGQTGETFDKKDVIPENKWVHKSYKFIAPSNKFDFTIYSLFSDTNEMYLDNLQLFLADDEIVDNIYDNVFPSIIIDNPVQKETKIGDIVRFSSPDEDETYIIFYVPPITVVDYKDSILCRFKIDLKFTPKIEYMANYRYLDEMNEVYQSEPFVLSGFIVPNDEDIELVVGKV